MKKRAALHNLGCKVNAYETDAMQQLLEEAGYEIVPFDGMADVYVINTCSVTGIADRKSRQMIHRAKKKNPDGIVVAAGCYVQTHTEEALEDLAVDIVIGNNKKGDLPEVIEAFLRSRKKEVDCVDINAGSQPYEPLHIARTAEHTRAFIKVQDGCNQFCSYCIIPYARGRIRSRGKEDVVEEVRRLAQNGYREVVLTGIHLSSYGKDLENGDALLDLIEAVHGVEGIHRIRLGSLEPQIVTEEFARRLSALPKVCAHFHLSLQSGCDATLRRMNRKYTTEAYAKSCEFLRRYFSHPAITTDVIAGFPGETEEEFAATKQFLKEIHFYEMHIFKYSRREGTVAARLPDQVADAVKSARSRELLDLADVMSGEFRAYHIGRETEALLEEPVWIDGKQYLTGFTKEYVKIAVEAEENRKNQLVRGRIAGELAGDLLLLVEFSN